MPADGQGQLVLLPHIEGKAVDGLLEVGGQLLVFRIQGRYGDGGRLLLLLLLLRAGCVEPCCMCVCVVVCLCVCSCAGW